MRRCVWAAILIHGLASLWFSATCTADEPASPPPRWVDPRCSLLDCTKDGPFARDGDGSLLYFEKKQLWTSADDGRTWAARGPEIEAGIQLEHVGHVGHFIRLPDGSLVVVYLNFDGYKFEWDDEKNEPRPTCKLEMWGMRSSDGGLTWSDNQQILPGYNADFMGLIQTRGGRVVATFEHLDFELKRFLVGSVYSDDGGKTWQISNFIDMGGRGHHDGALEPMLVELKDGRLLMLIRTNHDQFWRAISSDAGSSWRILEPSGIDASSAPGWLTRLSSGRLALTWNRLHSQHKGAWPKTRKNASTSAELASWHREELSLAFSSDDGMTWTSPQVVAYEDGGGLAYPYIWEHKPGELWIFSRFPRKSLPVLAIRVNEADFP